jgi:hypothetical protein
MFKQRSWNFQDFLVMIIDKEGSARASEGGTPPKLPRQLKLPIPPISIHASHLAYPT